MRVAINGLGRIGRLLFRVLAQSNDVQVVSLNSLEDNGVIAHLLKYDSIHGTSLHDYGHDTENLIINGESIRTYHESTPDNIPWKQHDIDIVFECSGQFTKNRSANAHIKSGAKKVIVSAPCDQADATIIMGVNHEALKSNHSLISAGSCTTNALAPIAKILNDACGIESGYITTVHAYTADQKLIDGAHNDLRRARAASLSIIPTKTGAAASIGKVIPELNGKLSGSALRVPTANVSLIDLCLNIERNTSKKEIDAIIMEASNGRMNGIVGVAHAPLVSVDFNHSTYSAIYDSFETHVNDRFVRILAWYDNEWAFVHRMFDICSIMST